MTEVAELLVEIVDSEASGEARLNSASWGTNDESPLRDSVLVDSGLRFMLLRRIGVTSERTDDVKYGSQDGDKAFGREINM